MKSGLVDIQYETVIPGVDAILAAQGITERRSVDPRMLRLVDEAIVQYRSLVEPAGVVDEIPVSDFVRIYSGEGLNSAQTVLDNIIPLAHTLTLFAVTVGDRVSREISRLFERNDFAAGAMLDAVASLSADLAAEVIERRCENSSASTESTGHAVGVMRFSPGYCGWHVSGQKKLFGALKPERIGIRLNDSYLMQPLKSVSGVVVAAPLEAFDIDDTFPFCADCRTHSCRDRFTALKEKHDS